MENIKLSKIEEDGFFNGESVIGRDRENLTTVRKNVSMVSGFIVKTYKLLINGGDITNFELTKEREIKPADTYEYRITFDAHKRYTQKEDVLI